ncbi:MAG: NAD-dependent epimerase/dehydratase family protein [Dokdonella sp.]|uniref:NAD-dependent epimerase/dehydratase family protein n=1 Tax=Dokdonella sp. TaxID=2291710 RepID=UPI0032641745
MLSKGNSSSASGSVCYVTGGAGFIGCALSHELVSRFDQVIAIDCMHPQVHASASRPDALHAGVKLVVADVTKPETWKKLLAERAPDTVVHLAAETGTGQSLLEGSRHAHVNVLGTTVMLDAFARHDRIPKRIVLASSRAVYGEGAWHSGDHRQAIYPGQRTRAQLDKKVWDFPGLRPLPFSATTTMANPVSIYGATKLAQEHIMSAWCHSLGVTCAVLRLQNVYGPGQSLKNPYTGICSYFAQLAKAGRAIPLYEDGQIVRDFVYVEDVVDAILAATASPLSEMTPFDIGCGRPTTIAELAALFAEIYDAPEPVVTEQFRHGDVRHASCSIHRAQAGLSWAPKTILADGISRLCTWTDGQKRLRLLRDTAA